MDIMQRKGKNCIVVSEYLDEKGKIPFSLLGTNRETCFKITRNRITYEIQINARINNKSIRISSNNDVVFDSFFEITMDLIRFENLFEGKFFTIKSWNLDDSDLLPELEKNLLGYLRSSKSMSCFYITFDDKTYRRLFIAFEKYLNKQILQYHVSLYSTYLNGVPADLRMAQLLEVFEPLALEFSEEGKLTLNKSPYYIVSNNCSNCGARITRRLRNNQLHLKDLITAVIRTYGKDVFRGDSVAKIVRKAVALRNKIDHVDNQRGAMNGIECGLYLYKFSLLYRIIVMQEIGIPYDFIQGRVKALMEDFNKNYSEHRILP